MKLWLLKSLNVSMFLILTAKLLLIPTSNSIKPNIDNQLEINSNKENLGSNSFNNFNTFENKKKMKIQVKILILLLISQQ